MMSPQIDHIYVPFHELIERILNVIAIGIALGGIILLAMEYGFSLSGERAEFLHFLNYLIAWVLVGQFFLKLLLSPQKRRFIKINRKDLIIILGLGGAALFWRIYFISPHGYILICQLFIVAFVAVRIPQLNKVFSFLSLSPPLTVVVTFLVIIAIGSTLLLLPVSTAPGKYTKPLDALFTATSATCVTGLIVVDTGNHFSRFGQIVILILIQIGGLGLMTFTSFFALLSGEFGVRDRVILREIVRYDNLSRIGYLIPSILILTFVFEATGAILLYFQFLPRAGNSLSAVYSALFHSISAFCNAGFSIYSDSFINYRGNLRVNLIMTTLIISGGLGFMVIVNLLRVIIFRIKKKKREPLSLHSKLVLLTTGGLLVLGTFLLYLGEINGLLKNLPPEQKLLSAYFQSVTARTAGFNTLRISDLTTSSSFLLIILMFIGASPGSTGGGIKTSTFATLIFTIKSMIQGKDQVEAFKRTIPQISIYQALCVVTLALGWIGGVALFLSFIENFNFLDILFETFSAFGTVGLSRGLTPHLTNWGKMIIIITMLVGRIGPLTLALAIAGRRAVRLYEYPEESIIIG